MSGGYVIAEELGLGPYKMGKGMIRIYRPTSLRGAPTPDQTMFQPAIIPVELSWLVDWREVKRVVDNCTTTRFLCLPPSLPRYPPEPHLTSPIVPRHRYRSVERE